MFDFYLNKTFLWSTTFTRSWSGRDWNTLRFLRSLFDILISVHISSTLVRNTYSTSKTDGPWQSDGARLTRFIREEHLKRYLLSSTCRWLATRCMQTHTAGNKLSRIIIPRQCTCSWPEPGGSQKNQPVVTQQTWISLCTHWSVRAIDKQSTTLYEFIAKITVPE